MTCIDRFFEKRLESTNNWAIRHIPDKREPNPFFIRTDDQYAGRGLGENQWISEAGKNLTGSLVIFPYDLPPDQQFRISVIASLAVVRFLDLFSEEAMIKWPNDLYIGNDKIGGLLIENGLVGGRLTYSVIGIGLNINQEHFPASIPNPTSLKLKTGMLYQLEQLESTLLEVLCSHLKYVTPAPADSQMEAYVNRLYRYRSWAPFRCNQDWFNGRIMGVEPTGELVIEKETGEIRRFRYQEVDYIL